MIDINYFLYKPNFDKDVPTFIVAGTHEEVRPCYSADGKLMHINDNVAVERIDDGEKMLVPAELISVKIKHD